MSDARCTFCRIITGTIQSYAVFDDAEVLAFLDYRPLRPGHVLAVPKEHHETLGDLPRESIGPLFERVQMLADAVERGLEADGVFVGINIRVSQSVPHLHVHIVPRQEGDGLFGKTFQWIRRPYPSDAVMRETQARIVRAMAPSPRA